MYVQVLAFIYIYIYKTIWQTFEQTKMRAQAKQQSGKPQMTKKCMVRTTAKFRQIHLEKTNESIEPVFGQENCNAVKKSLSGYENIRNSKKQ